MTVGECETCPCKFCGDPTPMLGAKMCNGCWEVERNLRHFIRHWRGRQYVLELLAREEGAGR